MAAAPGGAAPAPAPACACSNISIMQLFHELKQEFPGVPDHVVNSAISEHCHDPDACRDRLHEEEEARKRLAALHPARGRHPPRARPADETPRCPNRAEAEAEAAAAAAGGEPSPVRPKRPDSLPLSPEKGDAPDAFPLNVSVNLNCRMDATKPTEADPTLDFGSPGSYASVNLTVCTPTSGPGPGRADAAPPRGFEGRVSITLSSGPPRGEGRSPRRARRAALDAADRSPEDAIESLLRRQRLQLDGLRRAIRADRARIVRIRREIQILEAPAPMSNDALQRTVQRLRDGCRILDGQIETAPASGEIDDDETNPEPRLETRNSEDADSWQCHVCTFRNHALLNKCEECDMPRIILVHTNDEITVQLHPGCDKVTGSWIL